MICEFISGEELLLFNCFQLGVFKDKRLKFFSTTALTFNINYRYSVLLTNCIISYQLIAYRVLTEYKGTIKVSNTVCTQ